MTIVNFYNWNLTMTAACARGPQSDLSHTLKMIDNALGGTDSCTDAV